MSMKKVFLSLLLYSSLSFGQEVPFGTAQLRKDSITLIGQYSNYIFDPHGKFEITTYNWLNGGESVYTTPIDAKGNFRLTFPVQIEGTLLLDRKQLTIGIPGSTMYFNADMKDESKRVFKGEHARLQNEVMHYRRYSEKYANPNRNIWRNRLSNDLQYRDSVVKAFDQQLKLLNEYDRKNHLALRSRQFLEAGIRYEYAALLMQFLFTLQEQGKREFRPGYLSSVQSIATLNNSYGYLSSNFLSYTVNLQNYAMMAASDRKLQVDSLLTSYGATSFQRELLHTWMQLDQLEMDPQPMDESSMTLFEKHVRAPFLRQTIREKNAALIKTAMNDAVLDKTRLIANIPNANTSGEILQYIVDQNPGKVIYIDIWGTWCVPCRDEMKFVPILKKELEGEDVVFVYLANSTPWGAWKNYIKQNHLYGANVMHFNLPHAQQRLFETQFLHKGYPTYILIDKNGKYITNKAPRPSSYNEAIKEIEKLL